MQAWMHANKWLYLPIIHNRSFLMQLVSNKMLCYWCVDGKIAAYWPLQFRIYRLSMNAIWRILWYTIYPSMYPFMYLHFSCIHFHTQRHNGLNIKMVFGMHTHTNTLTCSTKSTVVIVCTKRNVLVFETGFEFDISSYFHRLHVCSLHASDVVIYVCVLVHIDSPHTVRWHFSKFEIMESWYCAE